MNTNSIGAETEVVNETELVLVFTADGKAMLEEDGEPVWFSDDDDEFAVEFADRDFLEAELDKEDVLNYLVDANQIDEEELPDIEIAEEIDESNESDESDESDD